MSEAHRRRRGDPGLDFAKTRLAKIGRMIQRYYSYMDEINKLRMQYPDEFRMAEADVIRTMTEKLGYDPRNPEVPVTLPTPVVETATDPKARAERSKAFAQAFREAQEKRKAAAVKGE